MSQAPLPPTTPSPKHVKLENVQGDIIPGFPKKKETFVFFNIVNEAGFKESVPRLAITSSKAVIQARADIAKVKKEEPDRLIPLSLLNIAFSQKGLNALGIKESLNDEGFSNGQLADAQALGDEGVVIKKAFHPENWEAAFKNRIDGVLVAAGESWATVNKTVSDALIVLGGSIEVEYKLKGSVRPGDEKGHEHFGWMDGISDPAVEGIVEALPGQRKVPPGIILTGKEQDEVPRPDWAVEGSFLVFRQLSQLVPEFHDFLDSNPIPGVPDRKQGSELLGARLMGRWKSGAPIQKAPTHDDPALAKDSQHNNDFIYPQDLGDKGQSACPYAAHIRKTNPRNDLHMFPGAVERSSIIRAGIPYGPEVSPDESAEKLTEYERGLAFVSYQSSLANGFQFIQKSWANDPSFIFGKKIETATTDLLPGFDPIIGQNNGKSRDTLGTAGDSKLTLPQNFVVSRGGEYFFSPSIEALQTVCAGLPFPRKPL